MGKPKLTNHIPKINETITIGYNHYDKYNSNNTVIKTFTGKLSYLCPEMYYMILIDPNHLYLFNNPYLNDKDKKRFEKLQMLITTKLKLYNITNKTL